MLSKPKVQFSLRVIFLLTLFAAPVSVYIARAWKLPDSPVLMLDIYADSTIGIGERHGTLKAMTPTLNREIERRQHFKAGAELQMTVDMAAGAAASALVIDAAKEAGKISTVQVYPHGDMPISLPSMPIDNLINQGMNQE